MQKKRNNLKKYVVCFVGISGKPSAAGTLEALSDKTLSGKIISQVEVKLRSVPECSIFFRDNLVKDPPLTNGKLRYPTPEEMKSEWGKLEKRLVKIGSNVVILLGALVSEFFKTKREVKVIRNEIADGRLLKWAGTDKIGRLILAVAHPSYVGIYARKQIDNYTDIICRTIQLFFAQRSGA
jgi:uracil-DNA glycosylase